MSCNICLKYTGKSIIHGTSACALRSSVLCRRCHHRGHLACDCTAPHPAWERPITLEELIPIDIRIRYNIQTHTAISYTSSSREESELPNVNTFIVKDTHKDLNEFVRVQGIKFVKKSTGPRKQEDLRHAIKKWGVENGYRIIYKDNIEDDDTA